MNKTHNSSIVIVTNGWFPQMAGGLDRYVYELTYQLLSQKYLIEVGGVGLPESSDHPNLKLINFAEPDESLWRRLWLTRKKFAQRQILKPDGINLHFALYGLPIIFGLPKNTPVTFNFHGPWALESDRETSNKLGVGIKKWIEKQVYSRCDRFIVLSKAFGDILHREYNVDWSRIFVIAGGVDTDRFQPSLSRSQARERLGWEQDRQILFTPRRLVQRMGIDRLLEAVAQVKEQVPEVWLAIAGKGVLRESLEKKAEGLGLENHVQFLGFLPDDLLPIAYQGADLTVVPSLDLEGFGLILLESLACGTPVLSTPVGGMPEVLNPFCADLVTETTEVSAIATRLEQFLLGKLPLPSRQDCRSYAVDNFQWEKIAEQVVQVILGEV
jgi:glycosyltransferase involved in cell wall biosynthesis